MEYENNDTTESDDAFDVDSLFDSASPLESYFPELAVGTTSESSSSHCNNEPRIDENVRIPARKTPPPIPGLFFNPAVLLPEELEEKLTTYAMKYFHFNDNGNSNQDRSININQAMLFGRRTSNGSSGLPPFLDELIVILAAVLEPHLPMETYEMLFPQNSTAGTAAANIESSSMSRQVILNHYFPGEGITPHVDLLRRFADGIIGVSLGSGTVMTFQKVDPTASGISDRWDLYLPRRSIIVLSKDARYKWTHGIEGRWGDHILDDETGGGSEGSTTWIKRKERISITLRWLLPGADVVGS